MVADADEALRAQHSEMKAQRVMNPPTPAPRVRRPDLPQVDYADLVAS